MMNGACPTSRRLLSVGCVTMLVPKSRCGRTSTVESAQVTLARMLSFCSHSRMKPKFLRPSNSQPISVASPEFTHVTKFSFCST